MSTAETDKNTACPREITPNDECDSDNTKVSDSNSDVLSSVGEVKCGEKQRAKGNRRVTFPELDKDLVTQYFEPANPWQHVVDITPEELAKRYLDSCLRHNTEPIDGVYEQIKSLSPTLLTGATATRRARRAPRLRLGGSACERRLRGAPPADALEPLLQQVQFARLDADVAMDDECAVALFDMIEYYESATTLNISGNKEFGIRGWQACSHLIKKSECVRELEARDTALAEEHAPVLCRALRAAACRLRALRLQHSRLAGQPLVCLAAALKQNTSLEELQLGDNGLTVTDAIQLGSLLRFNTTLQLLDISNNEIQDVGVSHIADGLVEQSQLSHSTTAASSPASPSDSSPLLETAPAERGLAVLVLWNNHLTRNSANHISRALSHSRSLCVLNVGRNAVGAEVVRGVRAALLRPAAGSAPALLCLGLQAARLAVDAAHALAELVEGETQLQRIDLRDNRLQTSGLKLIANAMRENHTITQIDLDDVVVTDTSPNRDDLLEQQRLVAEIRSLCARNDAALAAAPTSTSSSPLASPPPARAERKISLTCAGAAVCGVPASSSSLLAVRGGGGEGESTAEGRRRLRSPAPSPIPSPVSSPTPSPARVRSNRFQVSRVTNDSPPAPRTGSTSTDDSSAGPSPASTPTRRTAHFFASRFRVEPVAGPPPPPAPPAPPPAASGRFSVTRNLDTSFEIATVAQPCVKSDSITVKSDDSDAIIVKIDSSNALSMKNDVDDVVVVTGPINSKSNNVPVETKNTKVNNANTLKTNFDRAAISPNIVDSAVTVMGATISKENNCAVVTEAVKNKDSSVAKVMESVKSDIASVVSADNSDVKSATLEVDNHRHSRNDIISDLENIIKIKGDIIELTPKFDSGIADYSAIKNNMKSDKKSGVSNDATIKIDSYDNKNINMDSVKSKSKNKDVSTVRCDVNSPMVKNIDKPNLTHPLSDVVNKVPVSESSDARLEEIVVAMSPITYDVDHLKANDATDSIRTKNCDKVSSDKHIVQMDVRNVDNISFSKSSVPETDPMKQIEAITEDLGNLIEEMKLSTKKSQLLRKVSDVGEKCKGDAVPANNNVNNSENLRTETDKVGLKKNRSESSLDSPDLEVLRYMRRKEDDRTAFYDSTSSLEVSGSSVESLNALANLETKLVVTECERRPVLFSVSSNNSSLDYATDTSTPVNSGGSLLHSSVSSNESVSPNIFGKHIKIHGSLSSLEASVSSLDSYRAPNLPVENVGTLMALSSDSGIDHSVNSGSDLKGNAFEVSSNEGTLTNSEGLSEFRRNMNAEKAKNAVTEERVGNLTSPKRTSSLLDVPALKSKGLERVRKISWVAPSPSFHMSRQSSDSDSSSNQTSKIPTNLEKLLSLFQHPGSLFSRSSSQNLDEDEGKSDLGNVGSQKKDSLGGNTSFWSWGLGSSGLSTSETKIASKSSDVCSEKDRIVERQESYCASPAIITSDIMDICEKTPKQVSPMRTHKFSEKELIDFSNVEPEVKLSRNESTILVGSEKAVEQDFKVSEPETDDLKRVQVSYVDAALSGGVASFLSDSARSMPENDVFVEIDVLNMESGKMAVCTTDSNDNENLIDFSACDVVGAEAIEDVTLAVVTGKDNNEEQRLVDNGSKDESKEDAVKEVQNIDNVMPVSISECNIFSDLSSKNDVTSCVTDLSKDDDSDVVSKSHSRTSVIGNIGFRDIVNINSTENAVTRRDNFGTVKSNSVPIVDVSNLVAADVKSKRNIEDAVVSTESTAVEILVNQEVMRIEKSDILIPHCKEQFDSVLVESEDVDAVLGVEVEPSVFPEIGTDLCNISILEKNLSDKRTIISNPTGDISTVPVLAKDVENVSSIPNKDVVASIVMGAEAPVRPRTFAAVLKQSSTAENSLERHQAGTEIGQSIENLPTKVIKGIKENISPENTLTSSMTNTKALVQELTECKIQKSPIRNNQAQVVNTVWEVRSVKSEREKARNTDEEENFYDESFYAEPIDVAKDALALLDYDFEGNTVSAANLAANLEPQTVLDFEQPLLALDAELRNAERLKAGKDCDYSPELVMDEVRIVDVPFFKATEMKCAEKLCVITSEKLVLKKATSMEDFQEKSFIQVEDIDNLQFKCSTEELLDDTKESNVIKVDLDKNLVFQIPDSASSNPQSIPALGQGIERRQKLRTKKSSHRRGCSPKSLPDSLNRQASLKALSELPISKPSKKSSKKHNISSLGKMARDSLLALNISEEEISEFRQSHNLTSVESLRSLESVSEDAASQSGNSSNDSRCRTCIRTSQESLISLDSISEDCRSVGDCELCAARKAGEKRITR